MTDFLPKALILARKSDRQVKDSVMSEQKNMKYSEWNKVLISNKWCVDRSNVFVQKCRSI